MTTDAAEVILLQFQRADGKPVKVPLNDKITVEVQVVYEPERPGRYVYRWDKEGEHGATNHATG